MREPVGSCNRSSGRRYGGGIRRTYQLAGLAGLLLGCGCEREAQSHAPDPAVESRVPENVVVTEARISLPPAGSMGAGYFEMTQGTAHDRVLTGATCADAESVMLHQTRERDGVMRMEHVEELTLRAGAALHFKPGGHHLMVQGLSKAAIERGHTPVEFEFQSGPKVRVEFRITQLGAASP